MGNSLATDTGNMSKTDLDDVETSGASRETANQDKLKCCGVEASHTMAKTDKERVKKYKDIIKQVAEEHGVDPALIAAIMSRESRAGNTLQDGLGDYGKAFGLMQIDMDEKGSNHEVVGEWDSYEHVYQATGILVDFIEKISEKFPRWSKEQKLKGGIAAYNMGDGSVHSYERVDEYTTGQDYSNDVVARAQWFKRNFSF
ncbi:lysozyme g-like [Nelusetta ayraudi]|uniref:lysozyme g-like n=1 Tax=Nelusetta ayraudi TaxID=303726 RepID=UPI003F6F0605